jgi:hypothetical protein
MESIGEKIGTSTFVPNYYPEIWKTSAQVIHSIRAAHTNKVFRNNNLEQFQLEQAEGRNSLNTMCVHIRLGDLASANPIEDVLNNATIAAKQFKVSSNNIYITTNANSNELERIYQVFPLATVECDSKRFSICSQRVKNILINQATCVITDYFVGSGTSSYSRFINWMRSQPTIEQFRNQTLAEPDS